MELSLLGMDLKKLLFGVTIMSILNSSSGALSAKESAAPAKSETKSSAEPSSVIAMPRTDEGWMDKHDKLVKRAHEGKIDTLFLGDSITEGMHIVQLHKLISPEATNLGIGGDRTQHLLWRLRNGELDIAGDPPKYAVVLIGTNNMPIWDDKTTSTNAEIVQGVQANLKEIEHRLPKTKILLLGLLPRDEKAKTDFRNRIIEINKKLKDFADNKHVWFLDLSAELIEPDGTMKASIMPDFLHPSELGYEHMFKPIKAKLDSMK